MDDKLPPHSIEAERVVLGCILLEPDHGRDTLRGISERVTSEKAFYDLRHQIIFQAMVHLLAAGQPIDTVTVVQRLKENGNLDAVGGPAYVSTLPDGVPSMSHLPAYMDAVCEKWLARQAVSTAIVWAHNVVASESVSEARFEEITRELEVLKKEGARQFQRTPQNLVTFRHFEKAFFDCWFRRKEDEYGAPLPFPFPLRIRPSELTLLAGDNGSGKSSMLGQIAICLAMAGARPCIASMEVPGEVTAWIMSRQLLGLGYLEETPENVARVGRAFEWLADRFDVYDFKGIANWRELLDIFRWAREHRGSDVFIVDSVMRIGIEDDDLATQGIAAARFADFALVNQAHVFLVMHERKGRDGSDKERVRGSKQWSDNAHVCLRMVRNEAKGEKIEEWRQQLEHGELSQDEFDGKMGKILKDWDSKFILSKQRWPGAQQNASRWLYFDRPSLQFKVHPEDSAHDYLVRALRSDNLQA